MSDAAYSFVSMHLNDQRAVWSENGIVGGFVNNVVEGAVRVMTEAQHGQAWIGSTICTDALARLESLADLSAVYVDTAGGDH